MSIIIRDPGREAALEADYQRKVEEAQRKGGPWPIPLDIPPEVKEFNRGVASSESVTRNFSRIEGCPYSMPEPIRRDPQPHLDESPFKLDDSFPSRSSFEQNANTVPYQLKPKGGR